jgi:AraC-like DNA-binding protein
MFILSVSERVFFLICGSGILQGLLLACLLYFHPKSDKSVNLLLALYICATSAVMSLPLLIRLVGWQNNYLIQPLPFLSGPLLYLYLRSFKEKITWRKALPHFLPYFIFFFFGYWNISAFSKEYPETMQALQVPAALLHKPSTLLIIYAKPVQMIIYYFLARRTLSSYQRSIRQLFSNTSRIDLRWARFLINGFLILIVSFLSIFPLMLLYPEYFNMLLLINMALATPYIYMAAYKGIMQPSLWQVQPAISKEALEEELHQAEAFTDPKQPKPVKPGGPNTQRIEKIVQDIIRLMEKDRLYQESELTLQELADKLDLPPYQISLALNEGMRKNFYDLVNGYRVTEAKRLLLDPKNSNFTILSVGYEAGFNSKTTFHTVFKKFTGSTPTEYRNKHQLHPAEA